MKVEVRPLQESDLTEADRVFRLAFGTFLGLPEPHTFMAGADLIATRWRAGNAAFGAFDGASLIGSNFVANWGSFGFFGPLTVRPDYWDKGVAQLLLEPAMDSFARRGVRDAGLFTFPQSQKHLGLYQKYDFWPQHLTAVMAKPVGHAPGPYAPFEGARADLLVQARAVTEAVFPGLDVSGEIEGLLNQKLGEIVTVCADGSLAAFAICHIGAGSEAGPESALVKFAAARPGDEANFVALLAACEAVAARRGMGELLAGVNTACRGAYQAMLAGGFRTQMTGVAMQRSGAPGYLSPSALVLGDWR
jgi:GNAT superfamily N-acetyltransferase